MKNFCLFVCPHQLFLSSVQKMQFFKKRCYFSKFKINESHARFCWKDYNFSSLFFSTFSFGVAVLVAVAPLLTFKASAYNELMPAFTKLFNNDVEAGELFTHKKNVGCVDAKYYYFHSFLCERTKTRESFDVTESCFLEQQQRML